MSKKQKKKELLKEKKRKKLYIAIVCIVVIATTSVFFVINAISQKENGKRFTANQQTEIRVYANGRNTITLDPNGTFAARLPHNTNFYGTYTEASEGNRVRISFMYQGLTVNGTISNNVLEIPREWDDGHGHGTRFTLR